MKQRSYLGLVVILSCAASLAACTNLRAPHPALRASNITLPREYAEYQDKILGELDQTKAALKKGGKIEDPSRVCLFYFCGALGGDIDLLDLLRQSGADINTRETNLGATPLMLAVLDGTSSTARLLLDRGADANVEDPRGRTPLYEAAAIDRADLVAMLLEQGANPDVREKDFGTSALLGAALDGRVEIARLLLAHGADANLPKAGSASTPLHMAALKGHKAMVELLIAHGANVNAKTAAGTTPLQTAQKNRWPDVAEVLKQHGAR